MNRPHVLLRASIVAAALGFSTPSLADTVCLRKAPDAAPIGDTTQTRSKVQTRAPSFNAVVRVEDAAAYTAKGFTPVPCPSVESQAQYRESICAAAEHGNSSVQAQLEKQIGEKPAKICAAARVAVTLPMKLPVFSTSRAAADAPSSSPASPQN